MCIESLEYAQEYCWKYGQKRLVKMLDNCGSFRSKR